VAFDARDGSVKWERAAGYSVTGTMVNAGSLVVVGGDDAVIRAFERSTGDERWCAVGGPTVAAAGDLVIAAHQGASDVTAYDAATGTKRWRAGLAPLGYELSGFEDAVVADASGVYIASSDPAAKPHLAAFDLDGTMRWSQDGMGCDGAPSAEPPQPPPPGPTVTGPRACVGGGTPSLVLGGGMLISADVNAHELLAFDVVTGAVAWRTPFGADSLTPVGADTKVLVAAEYGRSGADLVAFDLRDGHELWTAPSTGFASVVLDGSVVTVDQSNPETYKLISLDTATGSPRWTLSEPGRTYRPGVAADLMPLPTGSEGLTAYEGSSGSVRWSVSHPNPAQGGALPDSSGYRGFAGDASVVIAVIVAVPHNEED